MNMLFPRNASLSGASSDWLVNKLVAASPQLFGALFQPKEGTLYDRKDRSEFWT